MRATPAIATGLVALAASAAIAGGATTKPTVKAVTNAKLAKKVVVDAKKGMTLYYLTGDTKAKKCSGSPCTTFWPPLTVRSLHTQVRKGPGIIGKLTVFKRPDGKFQVALRGKPLYHYVGDGAKGQANGEGIQTFGGTWHAMPTAGY
jgi:predicted lipoprotein with Yx(FWY)xxD motif